MTPLPPYIWIAPSAWPLKSKSFFAGTFQLVGGERYFRADLIPEIEHLDEAYKEAMRAFVACNGDEKPEISWTALYALKEAAKTLISIQKQTKG